MQVKKITTKTPFRLTLTGGSDLIPYVEKHGGDAFGATIDKYVTVQLARRKDNVISLRYPDGHEVVNSIPEIKNPIIRQALTSHNFKGGLDLISNSDIPPGSGLGSSGAFAVGLINALHTLSGLEKTALELAEEAADLEINQLKSPIGKYDQYMAAHGGFLHLGFNKDGSVAVNRLTVAPKTKKQLEEEVVLVFSGMKRSASEVLGVTAERFKNDLPVFEDMHSFRNLGNQMRDMILAGNVSGFAEALPALMQAKKKCYVACTNEKLEKFIDVGHRLGASGSKIIGAGGGGFVYFYVPAEKQENFKKGIKLAGGAVFPFSFVSQGSQIVDSA